MACLPCMVSYQWIFQRLLQQYPNVRQTPFWPLVRDYTSDAYEQACQSWLAYTCLLYTYPSSSAGYWTTCSPKLCGITVWEPCCF